MLVTAFYWGENQNQRFFTIPYVGDFFIMLVIFLRKSKVFKIGHQDTKLSPTHYVSNIDVADLKIGDFEWLANEGLAINLD